MDAFFPKTRRPISNLSTPIKRPPPSVTPPKANKILATPTTPKDARIARPTVPPPVKSKRYHRRIDSEDDDQPSIITDPKDVTKIGARSLDLFQSPRSIRTPTTPQKRRPISVRELFKTAHLHDKEGKDKSSTDLRSSPNELAKPLRTSVIYPLQSPQKDRNDDKLYNEEPSPSAIIPDSNDIISRGSELIVPISPRKITSGPLKGLSTGLLDLIRAKEAASKLMTPEQERTRELLGIAPEVTRIVSTVFTALKRDILPYDKIVEKCYRGLKSNYTTPTIIDCLNMLDKVAPEWVSTVTISKGRFMRINRDKYTLPQLLNTIKQHKEKLRID